MSHNKKNISLFAERKAEVEKEFEKLITRKNKMLFSTNGIYNKYKHSVITRKHVPLEWRYDMNEETNPYFMERISFNAAFNAGAIKWQGKYVLVAPKAWTASRFSPWPRALTAWTTSATGSAPSRCRRSPAILTPTSTTCA